MDLVISAAIQKALQTLKNETEPLERIETNLDNIIQRIKTEEDKNPTDVRRPSKEHCRLQRDVKTWLGQVEADFNEIELINTEDLIDPLSDEAASKVHPRASTQSISTIAGDVILEKRKEMNELTRDIIEKPGVTPGFSGSGVASGSQGQKVNVKDMLNINVIEDTSSSDEEKIIQKKKNQKKKNVKKQRKQKK